MSEAREAEERLHWSERIGAVLGFDGTVLPARVMVPMLVLGTPDDVIVPHHHQRATADAAARAALPRYPQTRQTGFLERLMHVLRG